MDLTMFLKLAIFTTLLLLAPTATNSQFLRPPQPPRPLCSSQLALANHACELVPYTPVPPPSPTTPPPSPLSPPGPPSPDGEEHRQRHRHRHRHGHRHNNHTTPVDQQCCRWLKEVDTECVCDLLVRLPPFLARPSHAYTVAVDDTCQVTYQCAGRLKA